jgi:hypothetical protein
MLASRAPTQPAVRPPSQVSRMGDVANAWRMLCARVHDDVDFADSDKTVPLDGTVLAVMHDCRRITGGGEGKGRRAGLASCTGQGRQARDSRSPHLEQNHNV